MESTLTYLNPAKLIPYISNTKFADLLGRHELPADTSSISPFNLSCGSIREV
jgi:hypothetical protein